MSTNHFAAPDISLKAIGKLSGPILVANLAIIGGATIDTIMAGHLGANHLAAIALGGASMVSVFMGLVGILQGMSPLVGHHFGSHRFQSIGYEMSQNLWIVLLLCLFGMPILGWTELWTSLGHLEGEVKTLASQYLFIIMLGLPAALANRTFVALNAAVSRPKITMYITLLCLALKAPFNALFMYGWFGLPAMGAPGAAVSSLMTYSIALICFILVWCNDPYFKRMHTGQFHWPNVSAIKEQLKIGIPIGLSMFFETSSFTLMAIFIARFGAITLSAHQIVANITAMCFMIPLSIGIASTVLVAQSLGAGSPKTAYEATKRTHYLAIVIAAVMSAVLYLARFDIISLYTNDSEVINLAASVIIFASIYHVFDAMQCVGANALRGYRVTMVPMVLYGILLWGVGLGGGYYMGFDGSLFNGPYGIHGFWMMVATGLFFAGLVLMALAFWVAKEKAKDERHHY